LAKKKKKTNYLNFILLLVFISFIIYLVDNWRITKETYTVHEGVVENSIESEGTIIKDEKTVYAHSSGNVSFYKENGEKVKSGILVAEQFNDKNSKEISDEISIIDKVIEIKNDELITGKSSEIIYYEETEKKIQNMIFDENFSILLETVSSMNNDFSDIYSGYENYSIQELTTLKSSLISDISSDSISYYSPKGGLISYCFDGLEQKYTLEGLESLNINDIKKMDYELVNQVNSYIQHSDPIFKIIDNFKWYLAVELDRESANIIRDNRYLKIRLKKIDKTLYSTVTSLTDYGEKSLLVLMVDRYLYEYLDDRYINVDLILKEYEGLKVTKESMIEYEGQTGVFVSDANKVVKFRPVTVIGENSIYAIINEGEKVNIGSRGRVLIEEILYYTIKTYDSIIENPDNIYDGQILR
jgi:putative membrane fusion protein